MASLWDITKQLNKLEHNQALPLGLTRTAGLLSHELIALESEVKKSGGYWRSIKKYAQDKKSQGADIEFLKNKIKALAKKMNKLIKSLRAFQSLQKEMLQITRRWNRIMEVVADQFPKVGVEKKVEITKGEVYLIR